MTLMTNCIAPKTFVHDIKVTKKEYMQQGQVQEGEKAL